MTFIQSIIVVVIGAWFAFIAAWFWHGKKQAIAKAERIAQGHEELKARVRDMELQTAQLGQSILPINAAFQAILIKELTHFHTPRMDELLVKLGPPFSLSEEEAVELRLALEERESDMGDLISDSERDAARMLPLIIKRVKLESEALAHSATQLKLVTVIPDEAKETKGRRER